MSLIANILRFDVPFLLLLQSLQHPLLTEVMRAITFFGHPLFWLLVVAIVYWLGKENESFFLANLILFSALIVAIIKPVVGRIRPSEEMFKVLIQDTYSRFSFPSGHATLAASYYGHLWDFLKKYNKVFFGLLVIGVMLSRVYLGVHYLTDVLAGLVIGLVIGKLNYFSRINLIHHHFKLSKAQKEIALIILVCIAIIALFFFERIPLVALLIGFYFGFFLSKELNIHAKKESTKKLLKKQLLGFTGLVLIASPLSLIPSLTTNFTLQFMTFFILGFWISFIYPTIYEKVLKTRI